MAREGLTFQRFKRGILRAVGDKLGGPPQDHFDLLPIGQRPTADKAPSNQVF
jgi:hypothetical protein